MIGDPSDLIGKICSCDVLNLYYNLLATVFRVLYFVFVVM